MKSPFPHEIVLVVREMMERHWTASEIASRAKLDPFLVSQVIDFVKNMLS